MSTAGTAQSAKSPRARIWEMRQIQFKLPADLALRLEARAAALGLELGDLGELLVLRDLEGGDLSAVTEAELLREKERLRLRSGQ